MWLGRRRRQEQLEQLVEHLGRLVGVQQQLVKTMTVVGTAMLGLCKHAGNLADSLEEVRKLQQTTLDRGEETLRKAEQSAAAARSSLQPLLELLSDAFRRPPMTTAQPGAGAQEAVEAGAQGAVNVSPPAD